MTMTQNIPTTVKPLMKRLPCYDDDATWKSVKHIQRTDGYPVEAGVHLLEFYDRFTVTANRQMEMAIDRMQKTRQGFRILNVTVQPDYKAILIQHEGYYPDEILFPEH